MSSQTKLLLCVLFPVNMLQCRIEFCFICCVEMNFVLYAVAFELS